MATKKLNPIADDAKLEAEILGMADAVWIPQRHWTGKMPANICHARALFPARGVRPPVGRGPTGRMQMMRQLTDIEAGGRVRLFRSPGSLHGARLTDLAEADTRDACGLPSIEQSLAALMRLADLSNRDPSKIDDACIPETALAGVKWGLEQPTKPLVLLEELLLPVLSRGFVVSNSDIKGRVYYAVSPAGWELLDTSPAIDETSPSADRWAPDYDVYLDAQNLALNRLASTATEVVGVIGFLPLPASHANLPIGPYKLAEVTP